LPGYSQLARLEPTVFRRRSRRLQLTSLEQLSKSKTANLITSSALRWECPVNGITSETQVLAYHWQNIVTLDVGQISSSDLCADIPTTKRSGRILHSTDLQQHPRNGRQGKPF